MLISERIIEASAKMFAEHGVKAIRMDDIASQVGISKRTLYELFKDKDTLIVEALEKHYNNIEKMQKERISKADNIIEEFMLLLEDWDRTMIANYSLMEGVRKFYPRIFNEIVVERTRIGSEKLKDRIQQGVDDGYILKEINVGLAVSVFTDSIFGVISRAEMFLPSNISTAEAFKYIVTFFFRGISTERGIKILDKYIKN